MTSIQILSAKTVWHLNCLPMILAIWITIGTGLMVHADIVEPGFDLFQTPGDGSTFVDLSAFNLGVVPLEGNQSLLGAGIGNTDTIVVRKQGIDPFDFDPPGPDSGTVDIELVALSLKSIDPVDLTPLGGPFIGVSSDLFITINHTTPYFDAGSNPVYDGTGVTNKFPNLPQPDSLALSTGQMQITHDNPDGVFSNDGLFTANFPNVFADTIFTLVGGDPNNAGDILFSQAAPPILLNSSGGWTHTIPPGYPNNPMFPAGNFYITNITHTGPHQPVPVPEPTSFAFLGLVAIGLFGCRFVRAGWRRLLLST